MSWLSRYRIPLLLFALALVGFGAVSGKRLLRQSPDPHFVLLADAWLHGRLDIDPAKKKGDDWAAVETVRLRDGRELRGRRMHSRPSFQIAGGGEVPKSEIERSLGKTLYVSFPPAPALLYLPQAAIWGHRANDVPVAVALAAAVLPLAFLVLRRLRALGASERSPGQDAWLAVALGFGTVFFFSAVQGRVWFTAHVLGVALSLLYLLCALEARRPILAGLLLGLATLTRTPMAFLFPIFALEAWRTCAGDRSPRQLLADASARRALLRSWALFAAPVVLIAIAAMWHNQVRFGAPASFGHAYLEVRQQARMETSGLFDYDYLSRNLAVALALLPSFQAKWPVMTVSGHGLALWVTSPFLLLLLWPRERTPAGRALHRSLWLAVAAIAVPSLLYQNSGWVQFGYRFSLDYTALLIALLAVGGRPLGRGFKALVVVAVAVNLYGALTFGQVHGVYRTDAASYRSVIAH
ncbi:hypothetical protein [Haliangium sp.]|uniref:hypothetical protein n=1 Tax=Haliangium sp. TaxID=2663208 RepID=UPI003D0B1EB5